MEQSRTLVEDMSWLFGGKTAQESSFVETWMMFAGSYPLFRTSQEADDFYSNFKDIATDAGHPEVGIFAIAVHERMKARTTPTPWTIEELTTLGERLSEESIACLELQKLSLICYLRHIQQHAKYLQKHAKYPKPRSVLRAKRRRIQKHDAKYLKLLNMRKTMILKQASTFRMIDFDFDEQRYPESMVEPVRAIYPHFPTRLKLSENAVSNGFGVKFTESLYMVYTNVHDVCDERDLKLAEDDRHGDTENLYLALRVMGSVLEYVENVMGSDTRSNIVGAALVKHGVVPDVEIFEICEIVDKMNKRTALEFNKKCLFPHRDGLPILRDFVKGGLPSLLTQVNGMSGMDLQNGGGSLGEGGYASVIKVKDKNKVYKDVKLALRVSEQEDIDSVIKAHLGVQLQRHIYDACGVELFVPRVFESYLLRNGNTYVSMTVMERRPKFIITGADFAKHVDVLKAMVRRCVAFLNLCGKNTTKK